MTDQELDAVMKRILVDSIKLDCDAEKKDGTLTFHPSTQYQRQMRLMLKDPLGWSRKKAWPMWKNIAQKVAMVLLIISLGFATLMIGSPTAWAIFVRWITEWHETYIGYQYSGDTISGEMPQYGITELPEGFVESNRTELPRMMSITYENTAGDVISFGYIFIAQGGASNFDIEDVDIYDIEVNHMRGQFFESRVPGRFNTITWIDTEQNIQFDISTTSSYADILRLAESVSLLKMTK